MARLTQAFGWSSNSGWWVNGADLDVDAGSIVSVHESLHYSLNRSTSFGALLYALGIPTSSEVVPRLGAELRATARTIHEAFATFVSDLIVPGTVASPQHLRFRSEMERLLAPFKSPYLQLHGAWAIARACMQPDVFAELEAVPFTELTPAHLQSGYRPDDRLRALRRMDLGLAAIEEEWRRNLPASAASVLLADPLEPSSLAAEWSAEWELISSRLYRAVSDALNGAGMPTLAFDENTLVTSKILTKFSREFPSAIIPISAASESDAARVWTSLRAIDAEAITFPDREAVAFDLPPLDQIDSASTRVGDERYLHIAVRPARNATQFHWREERPDAVGAIRTTVGGNQRPLVAHFDLSRVTPAGLTAATQLPLLLTISESMLRSDQAIGWWQELRRNAVLLSDTPLVPRLEYWLDNETHIYRYVILNVTATDVSTPVLVGRFEVKNGFGDAIHVRPLTQTSAGMLSFGLRQSQLGHNRAVADPALADSPNVRRALHHIVGEDREFHVSENQALN